MKQEREGEEDEMVGWGWGLGGDESKEIKQAQYCSHSLSGQQRSH